MGSANIGAFTSGIDSSPYTADYRVIPKVVLECPVVGEQEASAANSGEGEDVFVVGPAISLRSERFGLGIYSVIVDTYGASLSHCRSEPAQEIKIGAEFFP